MCSVGDDNYEEESGSKYLPKQNQFKLLENKCNKCRENIPKVVLRKKDAYCKDCFLAGTTHKFKALLGKHRLIYPNDKVLVYHEGGHPSTALLQFLRNGLDLSTPKRLRFEPIFIHIEDKYYLNKEERYEALQLIQNEVTSQNFPLHLIALTEFLFDEDVANNLQSDVDKLNLSNEDEEKISLIVNRKANKTNKEEILNLFRRKLLIAAAKHLGCKCVFTTELAIDVASQLLTNVSLGRGIHLALDIGTLDNRDPDVTIFRPLRLFEIKELALYNHFNKIEPVIFKQKQENQYACVQNLMHNFVSNLQTNFPATITTIVRTGEKLAIDKDIENNTICLLCKGPIESTTNDLCSAESTRFSHWVSTQCPDYSVSSVDRYNKTYEMFCKSYNTEYCFACNRLQEEFIHI